jgi:hypothetical protein
VSSIGAWIEIPPLNSMPQLKPLNIDGRGGAHDESAGRNAINARQVTTTAAESENHNFRFPMKSMSVSPR